MEVECEKVLPMEDPSVLFLNENEWCARIIKPSCFKKAILSNQKNKDQYEIWYSNFLFDSMELAFSKLEKIVREDFNLLFLKKNISFSEDDIQKTLSNVEYAML